jgi:hypothetical protein
MYTEIKQVDIFQNLTCFIYLLIDFAIGVELSKQLGFQVKI